MAIKKKKEKKINLIIIIIMNKLEIEIINIYFLKIKKREILVKIIIPYI
jgi:hypothetical protein